MAFKPRAGFTFTTRWLLSQLFKSVLRKAFDAVEAVVKKLSTQALSQLLAPNTTSFEENLEKLEDFECKLNKISGVVLQSQKSDSTMRI